LHANNIAVVDYDQMWTSLRTLNGIVAAQRANYPMAQGEAGRPVTVQGMKLDKTDKVLIGSKTSWAVAQAIGEVRWWPRARSKHLLTSRKTSKLSSLAWSEPKRRRTRYV